MLRTLVTALCVAQTLSAQAVEQRPQFASGVERILVDVQVVDKQGRPVPLLTIDDFEVRLSQHLRKVASVEFIRAAALDSPAGGARPQASPAGLPATGNDNPGGRDFILAVDVASFRVADATDVVRATRGFIERLAATDRVGLYTYPASPRFFALTPDHPAVSRELAGLTGRLDLPRSRFHLSPSEVIDVEAGDADLVRAIAHRECLPQEPWFGECLRAIPGDANLQASTYESMSALSMKALRELFIALRQDPQRKTVVIVSGGLLASDRVGGRPDISGIVEQIGKDAAAAGANIYVLHMDSSFLRAFSAANGGAVSRSLMRESSALASGLERLAGVAGGAMIHADPGAEDGALQRILRETSAYYLLGVEPLDEDRDGRAHQLSVRVKLPGTEVRNRRTVLIPAK